jgi:hypothetical protein
MPLCSKIGLDEDTGADLADLNLVETIQKPKLSANFFVYSPTTPMNVDYALKFAQRLFLNASLDWILFAGLDRGDMRTAKLWILGTPRIGMQQCGGLG